MWTRRTAGLKDRVCRQKTRLYLFEPILPPLSMIPNSLNWCSTKKIRLLALWRSTHWTCTEPQDCYATKVGGRREALRNQASNVIIMHGWVHPSPSNRTPRFTPASSSSSNGRLEVELQRSEREHVLARTCSIFEDCSPDRRTSGTLSHRGSGAPVLAPPSCPHTGQISDYLALRTRPWSRSPKIDGAEAMSQMLRPRFSPSL